jgi:hypothetical protein
MAVNQTTCDRVELNAAVQALAVRDRPAAVAIFAKFGALCTPEIKSEDIPAVHAAFVEALKKFDASTP